MLLVDASLAYGFAALQHLYKFNRLDVSFFSMAVVTHHSTSATIVLALNFMNGRGVLCQRSKFDLTAGIVLS